MTIDDRLKTKGRVIAALVIGIAGALEALEEGDPQGARFALEVAEKRAERIEGYGPDLKPAA